MAFRSGPAKAPASADRGGSGSGQDAQPTGSMRKVPGTNLPSGTSTRLGTLANQIKKGAGLSANHGGNKSAPNVKPEKVQKPGSSFPTGGKKGSMPSGKAATWSGVSNNATARGRNG